MVLRSDKYLGLIVTLGLISLVGYTQNNLIPNFSFENGSITHPRCNNSNSNYGNNPTFFNSDIYNWRNVDNGYPWWVEYNLCGFLNKCTNIYSYSNRKYVYLDSRITQCRRNSLTHNCKKVKRLFGTIGVGQLNNSTFPTNKSLVVRYKIIPVYPDISESKGKFDENCCYNEYNCSHLRVFFSELLDHWYKSYSDKIECTNCNYLKCLTNYPTCQWQQIERQITISSSHNNLTSLILYPESGGMFIDDVEVFEECVSPYYIQDKIYEFPTYAPNAVEGYDMKESSGGLLSAGNNVTSQKNGGDVIIQNGSKVIFTAADEIELKEGFYVEQGAEFEGIILPCPNTYNNRILGKSSIKTYTDEYIFDEEYILNLYTLNEFNSNNNIDIFPSPANEHIHIDMSEEYFNDLTKIELLTPLGQSQELPKESVQDISAYSNGIYFLKFYFSSGIIVVKPLIIQR